MIPAFLYVRLSCSFQAKDIMYFFLQWLQKDFLGYFKEWEISVANSQERLSKTARERAMIAKETRDGLHFTGSQVAK